MPGSLAGETGLVWVTGAGGFIGSAVAQRLAARGRPVIGIGRSGVDAALRDRLGLKAVAPGKIETGLLASTLAQHGPPSLVVHAAGSGSVGRSAADADACRADTIQTTAALIEVLAAVPHCRLLFLSSAAVYGLGASAPMAEDLPLRPVSVYGCHKVEAEALCHKAAAAGRPVTILRLFSVYGPGLRKQLPWEAGCKLAAGSGPVTLFGTGAEVRDFIFIDDVLALIEMMATGGNRPQVVNGGCGKPLTVADVVGTLARSLGSHRPFGFSGEVRPEDPPYLCADIALAHRYGFSPGVSVARGMESYAGWLKRQLVEIH
jgi:UDP-glucose 4-epimerase